MNYKNLSLFADCAAKRKYEILSTKYETNSKIQNLNDKKLALNDSELRGKKAFFVTTKNTKGTK